MKPYYRTSKLEDVYELAPKLRKQDVEEVKASSGFTPLEALQYSFLCGEKNTIISSDGEVIGMFGVSPTPDPTLGVPWLLASPRLPEVTREFIPQSLEWVKQKNENEFPLLCNYVDVRNTVAIRWLRYLGFTFIQKIENYGVGKKPFYEFVRIHNV